MKYTRRRFLTVFASATTGISTGAVTWAAGSAALATTDETETTPAAAVTSNGFDHADSFTRHRFYALGTEAQITLVGEREQAEAALMACEEEVAAIESAFSIYDPESMLSQLNRDGQITINPRFARLLRHALTMAEVTDGAFDPTIQPLWRAFATDGDIEQARRRIGWRGLQLTPQSARFTQPDMAASFNGIAQGFAADQVSAMLARHGFTNTLVDLGEFAARGRKPDGPWILGIRAPQSGNIITSIEPAAGAIATSEPRSMLVAGHPHIIDPLERAGNRWASVTVEAREAWRADALSTAIAASPVEEAQSLLARGGATRGWLITASGALDEWSQNDKNIG